MDRFYLKFSSEFFLNSKIIKMQAEERGVEMLLFFLKLTLYSTHHEGGVTIKPFSGYTKRLAELFQTDEEVVINCISFLSREKLIKIDTYNEMLIINGIQNLIIRDKDCSEEQVNKVVEYWNNNSGLNKVEYLTESRIKVIKSKLHEFGFDNIKRVVDYVKGNSFLQGNSYNNKGKWQASFDWVMKEDNFLNILEGNYTNPYERYLQNLQSNEEEQDIEPTDLEKMKELAKSLFED